MDVLTDWRFETEAAAEAEFLRAEALDRRCKLIHATRRAHQMYERTKFELVEACAENAPAWICAWLAARTEHRIRRYNDLVCVLARQAGISPNAAAGIVANGGAGMYAGALVENV